MEIRFLPGGEWEKYAGDILQMLHDADDDFVPPLSARVSSTQSDLTAAGKSADGIRRYFASLQTQKFMIAEEDGVLLGFVSFRENYENAQIGQNDLPNIYLSTLIVKPEARGRGLTKKMYRQLFDAYARRNVFTRTWSQNAAHIRILSSFGFQTLCTLKDDRGKGIDTVYFVKRPEKAPAL